MQTPSDDYKIDRFAVPFSCTGCGQAGSSVWEEHRPPMRAMKGPSKLVFVSNGFHVGEGVNVSGGPRIVCDRCDSVQPD